MASNKFLTDITVDGSANLDRVRIGGNTAMETNSGFLYIDPSGSFGSGIYINNSIRVDGGLIGSYNEDLQLRTGTTTRMVLSNSTGNVGIGTTSPSQKLAVIGNVIAGAGAADNYFEAVHSDGSGARLHGYGLFMGRTSSYIRPTADNTHALYIGTDGNQWSTVSIDSSTTVFDTNGVEHMRITSAGNVGIGTTSPGEKLHVAGNIRMLNWLRLNKGGSTTTSEESGISWSYDNTAQFYFYTDNGNNGDLRLQAYGITGEDDNTPRIIIPRTDKNIYLGVSGGNVGIGTTSPGSAFKLDVNGYIKANSRVYVRDSTKTVEIGTDYIQSYVTSGTGVNPIRFFTGSTEKARIDGNGKVGIGTTSPHAELVVHGKIDTSDTSNGAFRIYDGSTFRGGWGTANWAGTNFGDSSSDLVAYVNGSNKYFIGTNAQPRLTVDGSGNVGIGTTSPIDELHVEGVIQSKKQLLPSTSGTAGWYKIGTLEGFVQGGSTAVIEIAGHQGYNAANTQDYLIKLFIKTSNGNSTGPDGQPYNSWYERTGGNNATIEFKWDNSATNDYDLYMYIPTHSLRSWYSVKKGTGTWEHAGTSATDPGANSASVLKATSLFNILDANVGIGTISPGAKLDVAGSAIIRGGAPNPETTDGYGLEIMGNYTDGRWNHRFVKHDDGAGVPLYVQKTTATANAWSNIARFGSYSGNTNEFEVFGDAKVTNLGINAGAQDYLSSLSARLAVGGNVVVNHNNPLIYLRSNSSGNDSDIRYQTALKFTNGAGSTHAYINSSGNVGIGTTSPSYQLDVNGAVNSNTEFRAPSGKFDQIKNRGTGNTIIDFDGSDFVGIGTTSPLQKLDVSGVAYFRGGTAADFGSGDTPTNTALVIDEGDYIYTRDSNNLRKLIGKTTSDVIEIGQSGTSLIDGIKFLPGTTGGYISFFDNTTESARFTGGKLGIGTTAPANKLEVYTSAASENVFSVNNGTQRLQLGVNNSHGSFIFEQHSHALRFGTANTERMRISSTGNVGIGTTTPTNKLEVVESGSFKAGGKIHFTSIVSVAGANLANGTVIKLNDEHNTTLNTSYHYVIQTTTDGTGTNSGAKYVVWYNADSAVWTARFVSRSGSTSNHPQVGVDGNNVKVFDAHTGTYNNRYIATAYLKSDPDGTPHSLGADYQWQRDVSSLYYNDGNVGIGTTNPTNKLHVGGNIYSSGHVDADQYYVGDSIFHSGDTDTKIKFDTDRVRIYAGNTVKFDSNNTYIASSGAIDTDASAEIGRAHIGAMGHVDYAGFSHIDQNGTGSYALLQSTSGATFLNSANGQAIRFRINNADKMVLASSGNVGIGTTSPENKLHVYGGRIVIDNAANAQSAIQINSAGSEKIVIYRPTSTEDLRIYTPSAGDAFTLTQSGNVGIGTTSPNALLDVNKSTIGEYAYFGSGSTRQLRLSSYNTVSDHAGHKINASSGNGEITLATNSVAALTVKNDQSLQFNSYGAGYLKSDASGNITVDTSTIEDTLDSVTDRGNTTTNDIEVGNITTKNDSGIYSFSDTVNADSSEDIFSISNQHGSQAFRVTFVCSTSAYSVAKTFEVVHSYGNAPIFFKVVDTGAYGTHDFDVSFTNDATDDSKVVCSITNNSTTVNANIVSTVFLGGSPTAITVTAL